MLPTLHVLSLPNVRGRDSTSAEQGIFCSASHPHNSDQSTECFVLPALSYLRLLIIQLQATLTGRSQNDTMYKSVMTNLSIGGLMYSQ